MAAVHPPAPFGSISDPRFRLRATSVASNASSNTVSSSTSHDSGDATVTGSRTMVKGKERSQDDLRLLAVSAQITEISYSISDIQTRIFEIQELRHQDLGSNSINGSSTSTSLSSIIDQALIRLDERLESVAQNISAITSTLEPVLKQSQSPELEEVDLVLLRKHSTLVGEWESVQSEAEVLRDELREDKWLAVFRNASDQADGMMNSLEKIVNQCHDFILQVRRRHYSEDNRSQISTTTSVASERGPTSMETYSELHKALEAKKKYYMPSVTKVLSVLDKGVRDRVTKNGESLRRHADMRIRWKSLRERISRTDTEMEAARVALVEAEEELSEIGSTLSHITTKSKGGTPIRSRASSSTSAITRSISPFRKFAARMTRSTSKNREPTTPTRPLDGRVPSGPPHPATEPSVRQRASFFNLRKSITTPDIKHRHSSSTNLILPARDSTDSASATVKPAKPRWNSSPRPLPESTSESQPIVKHSTPPSRRLSSDPRASLGVGYSPATRSSSRTSQHPSTSYPPTISTYTQNAPPTMSRPISRQAHVRSESRSAMLTSPRMRPATPSQIPAPNFLNLFSSSNSQVSSDDMDMPSTLMQRALSPSAASSVSPDSTPQSTPQKKKARRPSLLPVPRGGLRAPSPAFSRATSPTPSAIMSASRRGAQTPESALRSHVQQVPFYSFTPSTPRIASVPRSILKQGPPSSFRDGSYGTPTRPSSRSTNYDRSFTPSLERDPVSPYGPPNAKDPLDVQLAQTVNAIPHGFLIERVDPHLKRPPPLGEELKAQYAFSNALGRKILTCRLVVINRAAPKTLAGHVETKKVMCRVGGGWQDLEIYLLNRQAGVA